jgi:hypothetical protein
MEHLHVGSTGITSTDKQIRPVFHPLVFAGVTAILAIAIGCGGKQSTATKSAAAFDEAVKKGESPGTAEAHGGHGAASTGGKSGHEAAAPPPGGSDGSMAGMNRSKTPGIAGIDHSAMPNMGRSSAAGTKPSRVAGKDHSTMRRSGAPSSKSAKQSPMTGTDHSGMRGMDRGVTRPTGSAAAGTAHTHAGLGHDMAAMVQPSQTSQTTAPAALTPELPAAVAQPGQPSTVLRPDSLDTPAPTAVMDATRAAEMAGGGHAMSHGTYRQVDAGRDVVRPPPATSGHEGHQMAPSTGSPSSPSRAKPAGPSAAPTPTRQQESGRPASPTPAADPHQKHAMPSPRPHPSPSPGGHQ